MGKIISKIKVLSHKLQRVLQILFKHASSHLARSYVRKSGKEVLNS